MTLARFEMLMAVVEQESLTGAAQVLGCTQSAVSHQLRILKSFGIVKARRDGQTVAYSLADEHIVAVLELACAHLNCPL